VNVVVSASPGWPALPYGEWRSTRDALHLWSQIIGKTLLRRVPAQNHWWHAALRVSARGLATPALVDGDRTLDLELDLVDHVLAVRTSDGRSTAMPLFSRSVRSFYDEYVALLRSVGVDVRLWTTPVELPDPVPFERDDAHREYDAGWAHRFWQVLLRCEAALRPLAAGYVGKQSPVHFFWGSFDLAMTRFSGRPAPERPGADPVTREAYSHEVISFGFWPGGTAPSGVTVEEPVFYAYAAPQPDGFARARLAPSAARYDERLGEFLLPYDAVREAPDPASTLRAFCEGAYEAGATLGGWPRGELERSGVDARGA
jgi:hypothetical protein